MVSKMENYIAMLSSVLQISDSLTDVSPQFLSFFSFFVCSQFPPIFQEVSLVDESEQDRERESFLSSGSGSKSNLWIMYGDVIHNFNDSAKVSCTAGSLV